MLGVLYYKLVWVTYLGSDCVTRSEKILEWKKKIECSLPKIK